MVEDLSVFFADWGEDAVLDGEPVRVLYGAPGETAFAAAGGLATDRPRALIDESTIPPRSASDTDPVLEFACPRTGRAALRWRVRDIKPDGTGMATLIITEHENQA